MQTLLQYTSGIERMTQISLFTVFETPCNILNFESSKIEYMNLMNRGRAPHSQSSNTRMPQHGVNVKWSSRYVPHPSFCIGTVLALLLLQYAVLSILTIYPVANNVYSRNLQRWNNIDKVQVQTSYSNTADDSILNQRSIDFKEGSLNVDPTLHRQCVTIRFRGDPNN
jgi:hypothetical protein